MGTATSEDELENLFDTISDARQRELRAGPGAAVGGGIVAAASAPAGGVTAPAHAGGEGAMVGEVAPGDLYTRIGNLARQLHEALREVGADQVLARAARDFPDARDRLSYIARLTEQAADRVLAAVEVAQSSHNQLSTATDGMAARWERFFAHDMTLDGFCDLARDTRLYMAETQGKSGVINAQLHEIMMSQDFQDLTGQVIQKLTRLVGEIESQLLRFLIEALPPDKQAEYNEELNGPVVRVEGRTDVVSDQAQVDDLLESLGF